MDSYIAVNTPFLHSSLHGSAGVQIWLWLLSFLDSPLNFTLGSQVTHLHHAEGPLPCVLQFALRLMKQRR